jgi:hypothetical protein
MPANAETIGIVNASFADGNGQVASDKVVAELKRQAGIVGANGLIIGNVNAPAAQSAYGVTSTGNSFFGSTTPGLSMSGTAIFVP